MGAVAIRPTWSRSCSSRSSWITTPPDREFIFWIMGFFSGLKWLNKALCENRCGGALMIEGRGGQPDGRGGQNWESGIALTMEAVTFFR